MEPEFRFGGSATGVTLVRECDALYLIDLSASVCGLVAFAGSGQDL